MSFQKRNFLKSRILCPRTSIDSLVKSETYQEIVNSSSYEKFITAFLKTFQTVLFRATSKSLGFRLLWFSFHCFIDETNIYLMDFHHIPPHVWFFFRAYESMLFSIGTTLEMLKCYLLLAQYMAFTNRMPGSLYHLVRFDKANLEKVAYKPGLDYLLEYFPAYFCPNHQCSARKF